MCAAPASAVPPWAPALTPLPLPPSPPPARSPAGTIQSGSDKTKCVACPVGTFRSPGSDNSCQDLPPGFKATVDSTASLGLSSSVIATNAGATLATLDSVVIEPVSNTVYSGDLKTGIQACALGTEAYGANVARVPAPAAGAAYGAVVIADQSCNACADNLFASKVGTAKCQICRAGAFPTKSYATGTAPEVNGAERGPDQCTPW